MTGVWVEMLDCDLRIRRGPPFFEQSAVSRLTSGGRLADWLAAEDALRFEQRLRTVIDTGEPVVDWRDQVRSWEDTEETRTLSLSAFRIQAHDGRPSGVIAVFTDMTDYQRTRQRLSTLYRSAARIGGSLDVTATAQALVDALVPDLADLAAVDLTEAVLTGEEPALSAWQPRQRRVAVSGPWPKGMLPLGAVLPPIPAVPDRPEFQSDRPVVIRGDLSRIAHETNDLEFMRLLVPEHAHSLLLAPLRARGRVLGLVVLWRLNGSPTFDDEDVTLAQQIASRAALSVDNARRYTREHNLSLMLQRSLLPHTPTELPAVRTAGTYLPAGGAAGVGGDWFDVIELSSLRVALMVGDVAGYGLRASATMGRLRTAIHALADLDLPPDELLTHLDDLVARVSADASPAEPVTVTCLYAVYDPLTHQCELASAGHPPPLLLRPDRPAAFVDLEPGPPLGVGGLPFESAQVDTPEGSVLALYTDGLLEYADRDVGRGMQRLRHRLGELCPPHRPWPPLSQISDRLLSELASGPLPDDIALLLVRTQAVPSADTAAWEFPADPSVVAHARTVTTRQLSAWKLEDLAFTTELVVSELVTNAVRHAGGPIGVRLIRDQRVLICEVSDPSSTQPRLRRARETDENGRGLFLVAQVTSRWGSRYTPTGKTIWTEQPIPAA